MDSNHVANQNGLEMVKRAELHSELESLATPLISFNQPNDHKMEDDVILDIKAMLMQSGGPSLSARSCCIYKVPHEICQQKEDAYTPKVVSIGPLHYGNLMLQNMETHKQILFKKFIEGAKTSLDDLVSLVKSSEPRVRACYSENIKFTKKEFVKLILVDAGFIIALFNNWLEKDSCLKQPWLESSIKLDLLLLENQLPFFIVEELFNRAFPSHICSDLPSFIKLTFDFFDAYNSQSLDSSPEISIKHFTDLLRIFHLQGRKVPRQHLSEVEIHDLSYNTSADDLSRAGVKFKANTDNKCLLDLKFSGSVLEIPQIIVDNDTEILFRNMIALEHFKYPNETYIADYALVLDRLINKSIDVDVLAKAKIISNNLGDSSDVARLFNGLNQNILYLNVNSDYLDICRKLNDFYANCCNYMMATLRRDYCNTPWRVMASIAGIVLLVLTLVQTIFTIIK